MKALAKKLLEEKLSITWWGNIRFEKTFTPELCQLLAESGCVAVSGGLEVASDRLLDLMKKGVTVEQVARVTRAFTDAGIMVHAYLMYGFPTETEQDTVDALERVRQLFAAGCIQSAYWHRFAATAHSFKKLWMQNAMTLLPGARHGPVGIFDGIIDCTMRLLASTFAGNSVLSSVAAETGCLPSIVNVMKWF